MPIKKPNAQTIKQTISMMQDESLVQIHKNFERLIGPIHQGDRQLQQLYRWLADHRHETWLVSVSTRDVSADAVRTILHTLVRHPDITPRLLVARVMHILSYSEAITFILNLLTDKRAEIRIVATDTLRQFEIPEVVPLFERMARDKSNNVRRVAARALLDMNLYSPSDSLSLGIKLVHDPDRETAGRAFYAIKKLRGTLVHTDAAAITNSIRRFEPILAHAMELRIEPKKLVSIENDKNLWRDALWRLPQTESPSLWKNAIADRAVQIKLIADQVRTQNEAKQPRNLYAGIGGMFKNSVYMAGYPDWLSCSQGYEYDVYAAIAPNDVIENVNGYLAKSNNDRIDRIFDSTDANYIELYVALISTKNDILEVIDEPIKPLSLPKTGKSNLAHFKIKGKRPGKSCLQFLVYFNGSLLIRESIQDIEIKKLPGKVIPIDAPSPNAPLSGTLLSYTGDLAKNAQTLQKKRRANLLIDKVNCSDLLFLLYYHDECGAPHLLSKQVTIETGEKYYEAMRQRLLAITNQQEGWPTRIFGNRSLLTLKSESKIQATCLNGMRDASNALLAWLSDDDLAPIFTKLSELAGEMQAGDILQIVSQYRCLPWQLLYMGDIEQPVCIEKFLGMRFQIEHLLAQGVGLGYWQKSSGDKPAIAFINPTINDNEELQLNQQIVSSILSPSDIRYSEEDVLDDICRKANPRPFIYFFCHGDHDSGRFDRTWLSITDDNHQLTLEHMKLVRRSSGIPTTFKSAPLIFINACTSSQVGTEIECSFVGFFLEEMKAGGVIGSETTIPSYFATRFAELFWKKLLQEQKTVGEALFETRRYFWEEHGNPFGLLYSLYSNTEYRIPTQVDK